MMSHGVSLTKGNPLVSWKFRLVRYKNSPMDPPALIDSFGFVTFRRLWRYPKIESWIGKLMIAC